MGKQVSLIQFNGKVGNVVGSKGADGKMLLRARPVLMSKSQTEAQIKQRALMAAVANASSKIPKAFFDSLVKQAASKHITPANLFVSQNVKASNKAATGYKPWIDEAGDSIKYVPDYPAVLFNTKGFEIKNFRLSFDTPLEVTLQTANATGLENHDIVQVLVVCPDVAELKMTVGEFTTGGVDIPLRVPGHWSGQKVHVYVQAARANSIEKASSVVDYYMEWWSAEALIDGSIAELTKFSSTCYAGSGNVQ